ncbi:hypothetical protein MLD38_020146 [Melastoma candidum]|uniref:Uncharacterized protein n=1 Tax=Melastoma candidum TaxID=119954 RepID=A0ACB9QK06_9MYRT|nr:hypothetical protein MLD38_020146 [Melastoma candidum]
MNTMVFFWVSSLVSGFLARGDATSEGSTEVVVLVLDDKGNVGARLDVRSFELGLVPNVKDRVPLHRNQVFGLFSSHKLHLGPDSWIPPPRWNLTCLLAFQTCNGFMARIALSMS